MCHDLIHNNVLDLIILKSGKDKLAANDPYHASSSQKQRAMGTKVAPTAP